MGSVRPPSGLSVMIVLPQGPIDLVATWPDDRRHVRVPCEPIARDIGGCESASRRVYGAYQASAMTLAGPESAFSLTGRAMI
jgi:hypothetical protein